MDERIESNRGYAPARPRKHMGVATSDPNYLPPVDNPRAPSHSRDVQVPLRKSNLGRGGSAQNASSAPRGGYIPPSSPTLRVRSREGAGSASNTRAGRNYISQPKKSHSIFTSRAEQRRRRLLVILIIMIVLAVALALVWFFFLRK